MKGIILILFTTILFSCTSKSNRESQNKIIQSDTTITKSENDSISNESLKNNVNIDLSDSSFINLLSLSDKFDLDLKYATSDNFLNEPVYSCSSCFLRLEIAKKLIEANKFFYSMGYHIKLFDCYRPLSVQKKMWEIMPDARYVANPSSRLGSFHNRGSAVDLTLVDSLGNELNMGTPFDFFGKESHFDFKDLPLEVLKNRILLREGMEMAGFNGIRTEWWHFSTGNYKTSDIDFCNK